MNENEIRERIYKLHTKEDLLRMLNDLKMSEFGEDFHPFTMKQLNYYCNPKHEKRYQIFKVPKKKKGEFRTISSPVGTLKSFQHFLNIILSALYEPSRAATGFVKGKSIVDNASIHVGMNYVLNIDLENFFPSIPQVRIWSLLQRNPYNLNCVIANVVAGLCAMKQPKIGIEKHLDARKDYDYVLPQGAPTSPVLSNISCEHLDYKLQRLARTFGLNYSRYADDITFSSEVYVYSRRGKFWKQLRQIISDHKFSINENKTRLLRKGVRQEVTGLTVNEKINVAKRYVMEIRRHLNTWEKYGYAVAFKNFYLKYKQEKGHVKKGEPDLMNVLRGKLLYLKMVRGENDPLYIRLNSRFNNVAIGEDSATEIGSLKYYKTQRIADFEKLFNAKIRETTTKSGLKRYYLETQSGLTGNDKATTNKINVRISENADYEERRELYISLCKNRDGEIFYLIHKELQSNDEQVRNKLALDKILNALVGNGKLNLTAFSKMQEKLSVKLVYEDTMSIHDFEKKHRCKIELAKTKTYAIARFKVNQKKIFISRNIKPDDYREQCISKCRMGEHAPYYLIHKKSGIS